MSEERAILVGVEDMATAGIVAVEAAHVAIEQEAGVIILLHVIEEHALINAMYGVGAYCPPMTASSEEVEAMLALAEGALRAEYKALDKHAPPIRCEVASGNAAAALEEAAARHGAVTIVLGARRPHAFGRLTHPDVRAHITSHSANHIHIASLQAPPE